jgi:hypothetical protein
VAALKPHEPEKSRKLAEKPTVRGFLNGHPLPKFAISGPIPGMKLTRRRLLGFLAGLGVAIGVPSI